MKTIVTIVGARPQFIKAAIVSEALAGRAREIVVHTGQHYDFEMSELHFQDLGMRPPDHFLDVGSGSHAVQTAETMKRLEPVLVSEKPDAVLVYGDTNSTLAGALTAAKLCFTVAHVEAGLRSFDLRMPEEINRLVTDRLSTLLFAPNIRAAERLRFEGITAGVHVTGDVMTDLALRTAAALEAKPAIVKRLDLSSGTYGVLTIHRAANTDDETILERIFRSVAQLPFTVVFPMHPRIRRFAARVPENVTVIAPLAYSEMIALTARARVVLTDSGGLQREAYLLGTPCVTLRAETEWEETLQGDWNVLAGSDGTAIVDAALRPRPSTERQSPYGNGDAGGRIVDALLGGLG